MGVLALVAADEDRPRRVCRQDARAAGSAGAVRGRGKGGRIPAGSAGEPAGILLHSFSHQESQGFHDASIRSKPSDRIIVTHKSEGMMVQTRLVIEQYQSKGKYYYQTWMVLHAHMAYACC